VDIRVLYLMLSIRLLHGHCLEKGFLPLSAPLFCPVKKGRTCAQGFPESDSEGDGTDEDVIESEEDDAMGEVGPLLNPHLSLLLLHNASTSVT
jgi:hypothetical protein